MNSDLKLINEIKLHPIAPSSIPKVSSRITKDSYIEKVTNILEHIHRGDIYEVNFCQEFFVNNALLDPVSVFEKLNNISQAPFASYLKLNDKYMLCSSPERFAKKEAAKIIVQPIKGTARRIDNKKVSPNAANKWRAGHHEYG